MGVFYYIEAVALAEDLPEIHEYQNITDFYSKMTVGYQQVHFYWTHPKINIWSIFFRMLTIVGLLHYYI